MHLELPYELSFDQISALSRASRTEVLVGTSFSRVLIDAGGTSCTIETFAAACSQGSVEGGTFAIDRAVMTLLSYSLDLKGRAAKPLQAPSHDCYPYNKV